MSFSLNVFSRLSNNKSLNRNNLLAVTIQTSVHSISEHWGCLNVKLSVSMNWNAALKEVLKAWLGQIIIKWGKIINLQWWEARTWPAHYAGDRAKVRRKVWTPNFKPLSGSFLLGYNKYIEENRNSSGLGPGTWVALEKRGWRNKMYEMAEHNHIGAVALWVTITDSWPLLI